MRISDWSSDVCSSDLEWLTQVAPGIRIQVRPEPGTKLQSELQDGRVDMALDFFKIRRQEFKAHHVMDETLVSMARLDHPVVNDHLTLDNYTELPHVALLPRTRAVPAVDRALMELGRSRNVAVQVPRSEWRRVGKECVSTSRSRWWA